MIFGVSGATGAVNAIRFSEALRDLDIDTHLVVTKPAEMTLADETDLALEDLREKADISYVITDTGAC